MGIVVSVIMGMVLTLPISSAALGIILGLNGVAAGAATIGCCCQMIGFAVTSFKDNGVGGLFLILQTYVDNFILISLKYSTRIKVQKYLPTQSKTE